MAITYGPKLGLVVNADDGEAWGPQLRALLRAFDALVPMPTVIDHTLTTPPGSPSDGHCYIVGEGATGAWATKDGNIARWGTVPAAWEFYDPIEGWIAWSAVLGAHLKYTTADGWVRLLPEVAGTSGFIDFRGSVEINPADARLISALGSGTFYTAGMAFAQPRAAGKRYFELKSSTLNPANTQTLMGFMAFGLIDNWNEGAHNIASYYQAGGIMLSDGDIRVANSSIGSDTLTSSDVVGFAVDIDAGLFWPMKNGSALFGNPETGSFGASYGSSATDVYPLMTLFAHSLVGEYHGVAADFEYAPPAGFIGWDE